MLDIIYRNWIWFVVAVVFFLIVIYFIVRYIRRQYPPEDTYYFSIEDEDGNRSIIHDSGIRPSQTSPGIRISLQILKTEYSEGKKTKIGTPKYIHLGMNKYNLYRTEILSISDEGEYYTIEIEAPSFNPFYGKNISEGIREEILSGTDLESYSKIKSE
jgi:hypothetical protein